MANDRKLCPYCGEEVALMAKKCRYCGEWFAEVQPEAESGYQQAPYPEAHLVSQDFNQLNNDGNVPYGPVEGYVPDQYAQQYPQQQYPQQYQQGYPQQYPQQGYPQQPMMPPQIVIQNSMAQNVEVEQNVDVEQNVNIEVADESRSNWLYFECLLVGIGVWIGTHSFWSGVAAFILTLIACFIPVIGPVVCVVLGALAGIFLGLICATLGAATWIAWLIGIVVGISAIYGNLEGRKG